MPTAPKQPSNVEPPVLAIDDDAAVRAARAGTDGVVVKAGQPTAYAVQETFAVR